MNDETNNEVEKEPFKYLVCGHDCSVQWGWYDKEKDAVDEAKRIVKEDGIEPVYVLKTISIVEYREPPITVRKIK